MIVAGIKWLQQIFRMFSQMRRTGTLLLNKTRASDERRAWTRPLKVNLLSDRLQRCSSAKDCLVSLLSVLLFVLFPKDQYEVLLSFCCQHKQNIPVGSGYIWRESCVCVCASNHTLACLTLAHSLGQDTDPKLLMHPSECDCWKALTEKEQTFLCE